MARYRHYYEIEVRHPGLHKYRHIRGADRYVVEQKAAALRDQWDGEWDRRSAILDRQQARLSAMASREAMREEAAQRTSSAQADLDALSGILSHTLSVDDRVDWESLKDRSRFTERRPGMPVRGENPLRPDSESHTYKPKLDFLCLFSSQRKASAISRAKALLEADQVAWETQVQAIEKAFANSKDRHAAETLAWEERKRNFEREQAERNAGIDSHAAQVASGDEGAVGDMIDLVLSRSSYPDFLNVDYELDYTFTTKSLVIDYDLPSPDDMPSLREVRYVQTRNAFDEKYVTDADRGRLYDSLLYQMALRTLHEIYEADEHGNVERITFNGWVSYVDRATGADQRSCILSLGVNRADFQAIDLSKVDPKACFKALKGVAASKLIGLAPVAPLERPRAADRRFIESQEVLSGVDGETNLAAMDWQEFEHLVRQVFEAEFASANGEVRVTQASRDGGVDAVIFDPDPIRGGKIIVQAKRYTNVVEVSAVRDLYGTVQHEGASKGILVTTSQFGPDARKFAQDKPITLIDGGNLLYLLQKMGIQARIDLAEAKRLLAESA